MSEKILPVADFVYTLYIRAQPEKIWQALTSGEATKKYFFKREVQSDWRPGSSIQFLRPKGELDVVGEVIEFDKPKTLSYTFEGPEDKTPRIRPTRVFIELKPLGEVVKLTLTHSDLTDRDVQKNPDIFEGVNNGWPAILSN